MGPKRASDGDLNPAAVKFPKVEQGIAAPLSPLATTHQRPLNNDNNDFSGSVKKKLANSSRTGQACDRCKVRKIRCDGRPEGCSPCAQNRTPCKTTDRITGRATTRGHAEAMESENSFLRAQIAELQAQVKELGAEPRSAPGYAGYPPPHIPWQSANIGGDAPGWEEPSQRRTSTSPLPGYAPADGLDAADKRPLPQFKVESIGDNYLGLSCPHSMVSHITGTSLNLFGTEIDITDFVQGHEEYESSVMSYNHFLKVALNDDAHVEPIPFPNHQSLSEFAGWYLRSLNPYTMLLDKPSFMHLIWRIGNEANFIPSPAETVSVHMMLATIKYQISVRNGEESMMEESHKHYRYSLSMFKDLLKSHTWKDLLALTLVCLHMRNFPKPGAAWIMVSTTFLLAVELGLHRSCKAWAETADKMEKLEIETRKRIFWTLHALTTNISGKLGRPMLINIEDMDVEFPEAMNDSLPGEEAHLTPFHKCSFQVGIQTAKYTIWASELYRTIYSIRQSPHGYEDAVRRLENGIRQWRQDIPAEISDPSRAAQEDYIFALYLEHWDQEFQLLLHHPSVCRSTDPEIVNSNMDKCLAASKKMLHNCNEMRKIKSLDIPWINTVVYIAAISTTLFTHFQRKDQMTSADMNKLQHDMAQWLDIMSECGQLHGSGERLRQAVEAIVEPQLASINDNIVKRTATESLARAALQAPQEQPTPSLYANNGSYSQYPETNTTSADPTLSSSSTPFAGVPASSAFSYSNGATNSVPHQQNPGTFDPQNYGSGDDTAMPASHAAALAAATSGAASSQRPNDTYAYAGNDAHHPAQYPANNVPPNGWRQWQRTYMQQLGPPGGEYLNTATTLMTLGGGSRPDSDGGGGGPQVPGQEGASNVDSGGPAMQGLGHYQWPGIVFGVPNGHVSQ